MGVEPLNETVLLCGAILHPLLHILYFCSSPCFELSRKGDFFMFKNALKLRKMTVTELCKVAMLVAITLVLSYISGYLRIGDFAKFNISFIPVYVAGAAFGPVISGVVAAMADVISFISNPTGAFVPVFTILEFVNGFLFGLFLFREEKKSKKIFVLMVLACVLLQTAVNLFARTYFLSELYYGGKFMVVFTPRILTTTLMGALKLAVMIALEPFMNMFIKALKQSR